MLAEHSTPDFYSTKLDETTNKISLTLGCVSIVKKKTEKIEIAIIKLPTSPMHLKNQAVLGLFEEALP